MLQWAVLFDGFMVEARWLATDQAPTAEDYLRNGVVTSGVPLTFAHIFAMLGYDQSKEELAHDHIPSVISCPAKILRLWDDLGSAKVSMQNICLHGLHKEIGLHLISSLQIVHSDFRKKIDLQQVKH